MRSEQRADIQAPRRIARKLRPHRSVFNTHRTSERRMCAYPIRPRTRKSSGTPSDLDKKFPRTRPPIERLSTETREQYMRRLGIPRTDSLTVQRFREIKKRT